MTKPDWTPESQPVDAAEPLSATGMFLSAFGTESDPPQKEKEEISAKPAPVPEAIQPARPVEPGLASSGFSSPPGPATGGAPQASAGEFTRMFQAAATSQPAPPTPQAVQPPAPPAEPKHSAAPAPSEFTRIFLKTHDPLPSQPARAIPDAPPATPSIPDAPRAKGFSSPGASDSASAAGSFTQFFQTRPSAPAPAPVPHAPVYSAPTPAPVVPKPPEEFKWPSEPAYRAGDSSAGQGTPSSSSATGLLSSLVSPGQHPIDRQPAPYEPLPSFAPAPPAASTSAEPGSVTRLIQRLSESVQVSPPVEQQESPSAFAEAPLPVVDSGPGEFTRMISGIAMQDAIKAAPQQAAAPPAPAPQFAVPVAVPQPVMPHMPMPASPAAAQPFHMAASAAPPVMPHMPVHAAAQPAMQAPKIELPHVAPPKLQPVVIPAPKSKLQEMLPMLLVVNTFLLIVLILVVIFALKSK